MGAVGSSATVVSLCLSSAAASHLVTQLPRYRLDLPAQELHMNIPHGTECSSGGFFPILCPRGLEQNSTCSQVFLAPTLPRFEVSVGGTASCAGVANQAVGVQVCTSTHSHAEMAFSPAPSTFYTVHGASLW